MKVAGIILAKDEDELIRDCLEHLKPHLDHLLVLDGGSRDKTVDIAREHADSVVVRQFSGSFAEERNYAQSLIPKDCEWVLHVDVDERFNTDFLKNVRGIVVGCRVDAFRFPRINLRTGHYPDYQVRLLRNNGTIEWRRRFHEIPYSKVYGKPIDEVGVVTLDEYPITHLKRKEVREWW